MLELAAITNFALPSRVMRELQDATWEEIAPNRV
jgi:hypothetical protein